MKYGVKLIVITVASITVLSIGVFSTPMLIPISPIIRLNSLSCASDIDVWKLVFSWYFPILISMNVIIGLIIIPPIIKYISSVSLSPIPASTNCIPNATKNSIAKKSLNGLILDSNSVLNGLLASDTPAMNAPITMLTSLMYASTMNRNSTASDDRNSSSELRAAKVNILFSMNLCSSSAVIIIANRLMNADIIGNIANPPAVNTTIAIIAIRSCSSSICPKPVQGV